MKNIVLLDLNETLRRRRKSRAAHYRDQKQRLFPQGVKVGKRAVAWPAHEVDEILAAQLAGVTDDELRRLVTNIEDARKGINS
ncbi:MAG: helix-turn-helix transcriptional regulator, partial [Burkholderiales bacterium]